MITVAAAPPTMPPPAGGTISIEPRTASGDYDPSLSAFGAAASEAFTARGFTVLGEPGHAAYELTLVLSRSDVGTALAKVPGQSRPMLSGGLIVPLSTGNSDVVRLQRVRLEMRLRRRGQTATIWQGAAVTVRAADKRGAASQGAASDLTRALLQAYPSQPPAEIGVP